jgi:glycerophosphoryl diester phosphodiesterase
MLKSLLKNTTHPLSIAHRGGVPENRIESFQTAHNTHHCKMFECDVRLSKDEHPIIIHDRKIKRITGQPGKVANMTMDELKEYKIPSFKDVAAWLPLEKELCISVELKDLKDKHKNLVMLKNVIDISKDHFIENRMVIISFQRKIVEYSKILAPEIQTGLVYGPIRFKNPIHMCKRYDIDQLWLHHKLVTKDIVKECQDNELELFVWTVNDRDEYEKFVSFGVKFIVTDNLFDKTI